MFDNQRLDVVWVLYHRTLGEGLCVASTVNVQYYDWVLFCIINIHGYGMPNILDLSIIITASCVGRLLSR